MNGVELIAAERDRQVNQEGYTREHDDEHDDAALLNAAWAYLLASRQIVTKQPGWLHRVPAAWPWGRAWWKPSDDPVRNLVKAGALIAAEIDRLQRAQEKR